MKNTVLPLIAVLFILASCGNKEKNQMTTAPIEEIIETTVEEIENDSEYYFEEAIEALKSKDYAESAEEMENGIEMLKEEAEGLGKVEREKLNDAIKKLESLAKDIKAKKFVTDKSIVKAVNEAESTIGHWYAVATTEYFTIEKPLTATYLQRTINSLDRFGKAAEGETKALAQDLKQEAKIALKKIENGEEITVEATKKLSDKIAAFFKKHF